MVYFTPCKINLGLHILSTRPDGYHNIETCFYPVPWNDILELIPAEKLAFTFSGLQISGKEEDNLCRMAYAMLKKDFDIPPIHLHLHKMIPVGAGLGGGSSDAAATLKALNEIFALGISDESLRFYASQLGSDCSFFIEGKPMVGTGRGETLTPLAVRLAGKFLVLVNPNIHVSTVEAYRDIFPRKPEMSIMEILRQPVSTWKNMLVNDFETTTLSKYPALKAIKEELYKLGAFYAAMSGSGSSIYGLFDQQPGLEKNFSEMRIWSGVLPQ